MSQMPGVPCAVCRRASGKVTISEGEQLIMLCSHECARVWFTRSPDLEQSEVKATSAGGEAAGAYLDSIGKTDLAALSGQEWDTFCQTLFKATCDDLLKQAEDFIPF